MQEEKREFRAALAAAIPKLRRFAYALAGRPEDADDLLQATLERALNRAAQFEPGTNLDGWLFRICRNLWIDEIRSRKSRREDVLFEERMAPPADGERALDARIELGELRRAMAALSEEHRAVLALVGVEGLAYKEAARILDLPVGTVMSRLARARAQLARAIGDEGDEQEGDGR